MGWLITLGILVLLAILPLGVSVKYDAKGALVKVIAGPVKITLFPRPKKPKKEEKSKKKPKKSKAASDKADSAPAKAPKAESAKEETEEKKSDGPVTDFLPLLKVALDLLNDFRKKLRVDRLEAKLVMAGGDPCDLGLNYGRAWSALGSLIPVLEENLVIIQRDTQVECDFTASATTIYARADLTITVGRLLCLVLRFGIRALREFMKIKNLKKGGAVK